MPPTSPTSSTGPEPRPTARPTPLPIPRPRDEEQQEQQHEQKDAGRSDDDDTFPLPKLRLHIQDAMHPGASRFLAAVDAPALLARDVQAVLRLLYVSPQKKKKHGSGPEAHHEDSTSRRPAKPPHYPPPPTRSVTLILEDMDGVAYTKGTDLDNDHKEIHLSMGYVEGIRRAPQPTTTTNISSKDDEEDIAGAYEIEGVLVHELVHCFQYNGRGKCPGGLVEGIADWVRLSATLGAPHWRRDVVPERWDQGYEKTAYFLEWLEGRFGRGTVRKMNETLRVSHFLFFSFFFIPLEFLFLCLFLLSLLVLFCALVAGGASSGLF
jgi:hypothetical protein